MILAKKYSLPLWLFLFYLFTIVSTSCAEKEFHEFSGETMGTNYTIKYSATFSNQSNNKNKVNEIFNNAFILLIILVTFLILISALVINFYDFNLKFYLGLALSPA